VLSMLIVNRSAIAMFLTVVFLCVQSAPKAEADAMTEALQKRARQLLEKPYGKAPSPCTGFWASSGKDRVVVDIPAWAAASGLRRGDRPVAYAGTRLAGTEDSDGEVWAQVPGGEYVDVRVERAGKEMSLRIPCRDDRPTWEASVALGQAIVEGRWQDCIDGVPKYSQLKGMTPASHVFVTIVCMRGKIEATRQPPSDEYWRLVHRWATKAIDEARYLPTGLTDIRGALVNTAEGMEKAGRKTLADDIKQRIAGFSQTPASVSPPEVKSSQRAGTAFAIRPDGYLLTAFHVVKDATAIEVSCPEVSNARAWVDQFSESNDLAILRLAEVKTPTYLNLAEQKSAAIGDQVFTVGYPAPNLLGGEAKFTEGVISSLSVGGDAGYMQISVPVQPGNSGGALINRSGEVVGVVIASASALTFLKGTGTLPQNVSWAVKGAFAVPLFDAPPRSPKITDRSTVIRRAVSATCSVRVLVQDER